MKKFLLLAIFIAFSSLSYSQSLPDGVLKSYISSYEYSMSQKMWDRLADSAKLLEDPTVIYDPSYRVIPYPNGDVPSNVGVCTDVINRAFDKAFGSNLQETIHLWMKDIHPERRADSNIDHRRVKVLMEYFDHTFDIAKLYNMHKDKYLKGNIIIWDLGGGVLHIGICVEDNMIIHNIGGGQVIEPMYMQEKVIRNYNYRPDFIKSIIDKSN